MAGVTETGNEEVTSLTLSHNPIERELVKSFIDGGGSHVARCCSLRYTKIPVSGDFFFKDANSR